MFSTTSWHSRFTQQAQWTARLRSYIYDLVSIKSATAILDIGCGTGAIESEFKTFTDANITAVDLDYPRLAFARNHFVANWVNGNAFSLPFNRDSFDICLCHYLLLWVKDPLRVMEEMKRVTHPNGYILILAEPDYTHRIDFPEELRILGKLQSESLRIQGADSGIGPSVAGLLNQAGIDIIETGLSGGQWRPSISNEDIDFEWKTLENDLSTVLTKEQLQDYRLRDLAARHAGTRILYVPVFYAIGRIHSS